MSNEFALDLVEATERVLPKAFVLYGTEYGRCRDEREREGLDFTDEAFYNSEYHRDRQGNDTLHALIRKQATATFVGYNPKNGREQWKVDELAQRCWNVFVKPFVTAGIVCMSDLEAAKEACGGSLERVLRNVLALGRVTNVARRVAFAFGLKRKNVVKSAMSAFDHGNELAELHAKVQAAQTADETVTLGTFYEWTVTTLRSQEKIAKAQAKAARLRAA